MKKVIKLISYKNIKQFTHVSSSLNIWKTNKTKHRLTYNILIIYRIQQKLKKLISKQKHINVITGEQTNEILCSTLEEFNEHIDDNNLNILFNNIHTIGFVIGDNDKLHTTGFKIRKDIIDWYGESVPKELLKKFNNKTNKELINEFKLKNSF